MPDDARNTANARAAQFLEALHEQEISRAKGMLDAQPDLATQNILTAAAVGDVQTVSRFLAADPSLATRTNPPDTTEPIIYAVFSELKHALGVTESAQVATVRLLLDAGASPNASVPLPDVSERIPVLYFPCSTNAVAVARLLLERGANPTDGESVYHVAARSSRESGVAAGIRCRSQSRSGAIRQHAAAFSGCASRVESDQQHGCAWNAVAA